MFRQAAESRIIANAHRINSGEMPQWTSDPDSDFFFVPAETPEDLLRQADGLSAAGRNAVPDVVSIAMVYFQQAGFEESLGK